VLHAFDLDPLVLDLAFDPFVSFVVAVHVAETAVVGHVAGIAAAAVAEIVVAADVVGIVVVVAADDAFPVVAFLF
jgi:hypothetical protein